MYICNAISHSMDGEIFFKKKIIIIGREEHKKNALDAFRLDGTSIGWMMMKEEEEEARSKKKIYSSELEKFY